MPRFEGERINPNTGEKDEVYVEAHNEAPDFKLKLNDDGSYSPIGQEHQDADEYPSIKPFYVAENEVELSDGTILELTSNNYPDWIKLVDDDGNDLSDDDSDEYQEI